MTAASPDCTSANGEYFTALTRASPRSPRVTSSKLGKTVSECPTTTVTAANPRTASSSVMRPAGRRSDHAGATSLPPSSTRSSASRRLV